MVELVDTSVELKDITHASSSLALPSTALIAKGS